MVINLKVPGKQLAVTMSQKEFLALISVIAAALTKFF